MSGIPADVEVQCADKLETWHGKFHMSEFFFDGYPTLCSGSSEPTECRSYKDHVWEPLASLSRETERPTVIEYPSNHSNIGFWVTGKIQLWLFLKITAKI